LKSVDVGFVTDHLLAFQLNPRLSGYKSAAITPLYKRLIASLSSLPGVESVGMTDDPVLAQSDNTYSIDMPGYQKQEGERLNYEWERVTPGYFATLQLPLLAGRVFSDSDGPTTAKVVIVNESFVRKFYGTPERAIGQSFSEGKSKGKDPFVIVGVVKDAKHFDLHELPKPIFYSPIFQEVEPNAIAVYVRTRQTPDDAASMVRRAVSNIDSKLVVDSLQSMAAQIDGTLTAERMLFFWRAVLNCRHFCNRHRPLRCTGVFDCAAHP
jgi:hypothetical protein